MMEDVAANKGTEQERPRTAEALMSGKDGRSPETARRENFGR